MSGPKAPAGWYPDEEIADQLRYWDGDAWTTHTAPAAAPPPPTTATPPAAAPPRASSPTPPPTRAAAARPRTPMRPCPYCQADISVGATRCRECSGDLLYCPRCKRNVGLVSNQKFVGLVRGGRATQLRCMHCDKVLEGPRF